MGMYDTINGEQVKCFPWVSIYKDEITYHGGELKYYGIGDDVPVMITIKKTRKWNPNKKPKPGKKGKKK